MLVDDDSNAPAVVGGEMPPAPQDNGGEEMGAVYEPVHGKNATSVGTVVQIPSSCRLYRCFSPCLALPKF